MTNNLNLVQIMAQVSKSNQRHNWNIILGGAVLIIGGVAYYCFLENKKHQQKVTELYEENAYLLQSLKENDRINIQLYDKIEILESKLSNLSTLLTNAQTTKTT